MHLRNTPIFHLKLDIVGGAGMRDRGQFGAMKRMSGREFELQFAQERLRWLRIRLNPRF